MVLPQYLCPAASCSSTWWNYFIGLVISTPALIGCFCRLLSTEPLTLATT